MNSLTVIHQTIRVLRRNLSTINVEKILSTENKRNTVEQFKKMTKIKYGQSAKRHAAILIPFCISSNNELSILYTLRSSKLRTHKGQISFPGGHMEDDDGHEIECALRETEEEIGLSPDKINIWGMGERITPTFGVSIVPVIADIRNFSPDMLKANEDEVEQIFNIPLERLIDPNLIGHTQFRTSTGQGYVLPVYKGGPKYFWGMTAMVTHLFLSSLLPKEIYSTKIPYVATYK